MWMRISALTTGNVSYSSFERTSVMTLSSWKLISVRGGNSGGMHLVPSRAGLVADSVRYAQDLELNLVLFKMVEYLEKTSSYTLGIIMGEVSLSFHVPINPSLTVCQLAEIAQAHGVSHRRLFSPLWRTISARVVSNIIAKPQVVTHLCEFVGMEVNEFLKATQSYTLPWMVLWRRGDVIARIAKAASKGGVTVEVLCHENMGSILALLFTQDSPDLEKMAKSLLVSACEKYHSVDIGELVRPDAMPIAAELLKLAGDAADRDPEFRKRVCDSV